MSNKVIYVNGRFLDGQFTGTHRYAMKILQELDRICGKNIVILCPRNIKNTPNFSKIKVVKIGKLKGHLWEQIDLPIYAMRHHGDILTLLSICPLLKPDYWVVHDITFTQYPQSYNKVFRNVYNFFYWLCLKRCKKVITVSEFSKSEISRKYKIPLMSIEVTYNAVDTKQLQKECTDIIDRLKIKRDSYYLCVSSNAYHKNRKFIMDCAQNEPENIFVLVGGEHKSFSKTESSELCSNVIYTGYISDEDLFSLYRYAKAFIFPSLYEGFGIPPLEAMICGCKRIYVSDIPVFREIYPRGVNYLDLNKKAIAETNYIEVEPEDIQYYVNKYSWSKSALKLGLILFDRT